MKIQNVKKIFGSHFTRFDISRTRPFSLVYPETVSPRFNPSHIPGIYS